MIFWVGILIAACFTYSAIKLGFCQAWTLLFNVVIAVYLGIRLGPMLEEIMPLGGQYGRTIILMTTGLGAFLILQGISYVFLIGQFEVTFPRALNLLGSGLFGFLAGFLCWAFAVLVFCTTPLCENDYVKETGLCAKSFEETKMQSYLAWWCSAVDVLASSSDSQNNADKAVKNLLVKSDRQAQTRKTIQLQSANADVNAPAEPNYSPILKELPRTGPITEIPP
jgi:hypothetical protein